MSKQAEIDPEIIEYLFERLEKPSDVFSRTGVMHSLKKALTERILEGELSAELGYEKHDVRGNNSGNSRNGYTTKQLKTEHGDIEIRTPRDRKGEFEPTFVKKGQTRLPEMDEKIISLYARGMSTRDIQSQIEELYGTTVSSQLISSVTDEVMEEVKNWQSRGLEKIYPIVYLDALSIKVRQDKRVINKSFHLALGVNLEGKKELLGIWISENEGAKYWLNVLTELKNRGVEDILIACVDGLTGFPEAIEAVYPQTQVQLCLVHMVRNSLRYVGYKQRKAVATDLKRIYTAKTLEEAEISLSEFSDKWDKSFPSISKSWLSHWENITPFFQYPAEIRKAIYTTNAIESLNMCLRKVIKNKRVFPSDEAALKQLYLAVNNISKKWTMPIRNWGAAMNHFMIAFDDRLKGLV